MPLPADEDSKRQIFLRKLKWMMMAILVPEGIFVSAIAEWFDARDLVKTINATILETNNSGSEKTHGKLCG